ncbi:MAG: AAA family ATPase [Alphaproteobacteria bacterium]|nr:AAA family ATPase [Alphaproteobacteria bacterium]
MTDKNYGLKDYDFKYGTIVNPASLMGLNIPPREWFIDGLLPHGTVSLLSGDGGLGKSLLMQQLMTSAATGQDWLGMKTRKCKVFGLFCEDDNSELWRRQNAICESLSISLEACFNMQWLSGDGIDPVLMEFGSSDAGTATPLFDELVEYLECWEAELVIIDTAADTFAGNEISRIQVRNFINRALRVIATRLGATVILTSHPSVAGMRDGTGLSGSTAWNNSVRSRLYLTRPEDEKNTNVRLLQMKKSNYGSTEPEIRIVWQDGVFYPVENTIGQKPEDRHTHDEAAYLHALIKLHERNQRPLIHKNQVTYAPKLMKAMQETKGISETRLESAQNRLMDKAVIANLEETTGPQSKRKCFIQIANPDMAKDIMNLKLF